MGTCRENKNIFRILFKVWKYTDSSTGKVVRKWDGKRLFTKQFWNYREYIWHDTFGAHWNRFVVCPVKGHTEVQNVADPGEPVDMHCFKCEQRVNKG